MASSSAFVKRLSMSGLRTAARFVKPRRAGPASTAQLVYACGMLRVLALVAVLFPLRALAQAPAASPATSPATSDDKEPPEGVPNQLPASSKRDLVEEK